MRIRSSASPLLLALAIGLGAGSGPPALAEDGKIIPLPDDVKEHLSIFGEGVLGEPRPAPEIRDFSSWLNPGPSEWHYQIVSGTDQKVRIESLERSKAVEGDDVWMRVIGDEFVEYLDLRRGAMHKIREDDQDVGYGTFIDPGVELPAPFKPGDSIRSNSKMRAYKVGDVDDIRYHGEIHSDITYVGAYQVTVPAGS